MRRVLRSLLRPVRRLLFQSVSPADPWRRFAYAVPLHHYGLGAERDFYWYFEGQSQVNVTSLAEMRQWLMQCSYVRDPDLFFREDYWQHPTLFELLRKGDCEDFALWTWRKLIELGYKAEFVVGWWAQPGQEPAAHAWVHFEDEGQLLVFDPVVRCLKHMCRPFHAAHHVYLPEVSVDADFRRYVYAGHFLREQWRCPEAQISTSLERNDRRHNSNASHQSSAPAFS